MKNQSETFSEMLDAHLHETGRGSQEQLALTLSGQPNCDLSAKQIYRKLTAFRSDIDGGRTFDLAMGLLLICPEILAQVAKCAGFDLIPQPSAVHGPADAVRAAAAALQEESSAMSQLLSAIEDDVYTDAELKSFQKQLEKARAANSKAESIARSLNQRTRRQ